MISTLQNIGHTAPAALNVTSQHSAAAKKTSFEEVMNTDTKSLAREMYDSVSHLSREDAVQALIHMPGKDNWPMNGAEWNAYNNALRVVALEDEIEHNLKQAEIANQVRSELIDERSTASGERLEFLRTEIPAMADYAANLRLRAEQLRVQVAQMIDDL